MSEQAKPHSEMSEYEAAAWAQLIERVGRRDRIQRIRPVAKVTELAAATSERIEKFATAMTLRSASSVLAKPLTDLQELLQRASSSTVSSKRLLRRAARRDPSITTLADIRKADLEIADRLLSRHTLAYGIGLGLEGAATSLLVTGFVVSSSVSGGVTLAAAAGALATDVSTNLAASARLVAKIAMSYGYDLELRDERLYLLGVLGYGSSVTASGKAASLAELSRLAQSMMRHTPHAELASEFVLVKVTQAFMKSMGFRLTHQRLAQLVPFIGVVVNAGTNAGGIMHLSERAQDVYRLRFLTEKYGMDAAAWLSRVEPTPPEDIDEVDDSIDLEAMIEEAKNDPRPEEV